jgi:Zn-finger nucleic acid-binding protein
VKDAEEIVFPHKNVTMSSSSVLIAICPHCGYQWARRRETNKITIQCPNCLKRFKNLSAPKHELLKSDLHAMFESLKKKYPEYSSSLEAARFISINIIKLNINSHNLDLLIQKILELIKTHSSNA